MQTPLPSLPPAATAAEIAPAGVWLARAQQLKDTLTILSLNVLLLFGLMMLGLPVPGLVLYGLRWRLARGRGSRSFALTLWGLGLGHEVLCALLFSSADLHNELHEMATWLTWGYSLGALLSAAGLLQTFLNPSSPSDSLPQ